jgi:hypothetical protein
VFCPIHLDDFTDFDIDEEKDEDFLKNLWNTIQIEAANTLEKNVLSNWKWLDTVPCYMSKLAQTQTLVWQFDHKIELIWYSNFSSLANAAHFYDRIILKYLVFFP